MRRHGPNEIESWPIASSSKRNGRKVEDMQVPRFMRFIRNVMFVASLCALPCASFSQVAVGVSITVAPPPELPVYEQPICPGPNYMWTPGYWAWDAGSGGYYWVPGTWVMAPAVGLLWTPGYWGWGSGAYLWHAGYWGPQVGFYGGVNYGFGYTGVGFYGGRWSGRYFSYNTAVVRVNTIVIHNTYVDRTVIRNTTVNRVSYNGGRGGIEMGPTAAQEAAARQRRFGARPAQVQQERFARQDRANFASENHGRPAYAATARPVTSAADFKRAVPASGARTVTANETRPANGHPTAIPRPANETRLATRPESKPATTRPANENRPATKPTTTARPTAESRPATKPATPAKPASEARPANETRPTPNRPASTARPANENRPATRPAPAEHTAETRPTPKPAPAMKPAPETRQANRPATPQPTVKPESKPAPVQQARPEPQPRPETRPEPQPHPSQSATRPAPQQHESAPRPSGEKPHPGQK